jgi:amino acid transporter
MISFLVLSAAGPVSVAVMSAPLGLYFAGKGAPGSFVAIGILLALFSTVLVAMTKYINEPGSFSAYVAKGMGARLGRGVALVTLLSYISLATCSLGLVGFYASAAIEAWGGPSGVAWGPIALAVVILVAVFGLLSIEVNAKVLGVFLIAEMALLATIGISVLVQGGADGLTLDAFSPSAVFVPNLPLAIAFAFGSTLGIEATVVFRREARDPDRTIPRAIAFVVTFVVVFHAVFLWIIVQGFGSGLDDAIAADPAQIVFVMADTYLGNWAALSLFALILTSVTTGAIAFHNLVTRLAFRLAREGLLPSYLGHTASNGVPRRASLALTAFAIVVVLIGVIGGFDPYLQLYIWVSTPAVFGLAIAMMLTSLAAARFFYRSTTLPRRNLFLAVGAFSAIAFGALIVTMWARIDVLTGLSGPIAGLLVAMPIAALVVGAVLRDRGRGSADSTDESLSADRATVDL